MSATATTSAQSVYTTVFGATRRFTSAGSGRDCACSPSHENFTLKAGYLEGKAIGEDEVKKLAAMPSKETLIAQVLYSFNYPIMQLAIACDAIVKKAEGNEEMKVAELVAPKEAAAEEAAE